MTSDATTIRSESVAVICVWSPCSAVETRLVTKPESTPAVSSAVSSVVMSAASKSMALSDIWISVSNSSRASAVPLIRKSESIAARVDESCVMSEDMIVMSLSFALICVCSVSIAVAFAATAVPATSKSFSCVCKEVMSEARTLTALSVSVI